MSMGALGLSLRWSTALRGLLEDRQGGGDAAAIGLDVASGADGSADLLAVSCFAWAPLPCSSAADHRSPAVARRAAAESRAPTARRALILESIE